MSKKIATFLFSLIIIVALLSACGVSSISLINTQWQWITVTEGNAQQYMENPEDYVLVFHGDGTFSGKVDCNSIAGTYEMAESGLTLSMGPTTLAECDGPNSLDDAFLGFLKYVESYQLKEGGLTLSLSGGSTKLGFKDGGPAE